MSTDKEFDSGCILHGLREEPSQVLSESQELENQCEAIDEHEPESAVTPADKQKVIQDEHDQRQLQEGDEERILPEPLMLDIQSSGSQPGKAESEGHGAGDQSEKQKQKFAESTGSPSALVEGESSSQVQRIVLSPGDKSHGVTFHKFSKHWEAHIWLKELVLRGRKKKGVQIFAGNFPTEDEAKQAHDRLAIKFDVRQKKNGKPYPLNFPESAQADFMAEHQDWTWRDFLWRIRRSSVKFSRGESDMKGVTVRTPARKSNRAGEEESGPACRYEVKISQGKGRDKKTFNLGTHGSEEEAGKVYDRALLFINKDKEEVELWHVITNFRPSEYTAEEILEAGKKLIGFQGNEDGDEEREM